YYLNYMYLSFCALFSPDAVKSHRRWNPFDLQDTGINELPQPVFKIRISNILFTIANSLSNQAGGFYKIVSTGGRSQFVQCLKQVGIKIIGRHLKYFVVLPYAQYPALFRNRQPFLGKPYDVGSGQLTAVIHAHERFPQFV